MKTTKVDEQTKATTTTTSAVISHLVPLVSACSSLGLLWVASTSCPSTLSPFVMALGGLACMPLALSIRAALTGAAAKHSSVYGSCPYGTACPNLDNASGQAPQAGSSTTPLDVNYNEVKAIDHSSAPVVTTIDMSAFLPTTATDCAHTLSPLHSHSAASSPEPRGIPAQPPLDSAPPSAKQEAIQTSDIEPDWVKVPTATPTPTGTVSRASNVPFVPFSSASSVVTVVPVPANAPDTYSFTPDTTTSLTTATVPAPGVFTPDVPGTPATTAVSASPTPTATPTPPPAAPSVPLAIDMPLVPPGVSADCLALEDEFVRLLLASAAAKVADQEHKRAVEAETPFKPWPADWPMYWEGAGLGAW